MDNNIVEKELALLQSFAETEKHKSDNQKTIELKQIESNEKIAIRDIEAKDSFYKHIGTHNNKKYVLIFLMFLIGIISSIFLAMNGHKDLVIPMLTFIVGSLGGYGYGKSANNS
jgi:uncharacterized membrane protein YjjP (DUF1212 family)